MTPRLLLEPEAEAEFHDAEQWYVARSPAIALAFRNAVRHALATVEAAPESFPVALRDIRKVRVRRFPYVVYYVILADTIAVICDHSRPARSSSMAGAALMPN
jgi:cytosine/adenosine deaminase-related metal-dependent hydrolase